MTRQEFFNQKAAGALWDVGVSINRTNPLPLDKNAVFESYDKAMEYAQGVLSYPGQFIAVVAEDGGVTGYLITVAGGEGASLQKLAAQTATGDVVADLAALTTRVNNLAAEHEALKTAVGTAKTADAEATGIFKYVDEAVAQATPEGYDDVKAKVETLVGEDTGKSSRAIAAEEVAKIVNGADASYDTLKEIADWISSHATDAASMNSQIQANKEALAVINSDDATKEGSLAKIVKDSADARSVLKDSIDDHETRIAANATEIAGIKTNIGTIPAKGDGSAQTVKEYVDAQDTALGGRITALGEKVDGLGALASKSVVAEADLAEALKTKIDGKADKATTLAGYGITDAYTKTGADDAISGAIDALALGTMSKEKASDYTKTADLETALEGKYDAAGSAKAVDDKLPAMQTAIDANKTKAEANEAAIAKLNGAKTVEGSVAKSIDDAITGLKLGDTYAAKSHTHVMADITDLAGELDTYAKKTEVKAVDDRVTDLSDKIGDTSALEGTISDYVQGVKSELKSAIDSSGNRISTLVGEDDNKSVRAIALEELTKQLIPADAQESLNTLQEIAAWIQQHPEDASAYNARIKALEDGIKADPLHSHANKAVLDGITAAKVSAWDAAAAKDVPIATEEVAGIVKASDAVSVAADGALGIKKVTTDVLVNGVNELVLDGGEII